MSPGPLIRVEGQPVSIKCDVDEYGGPREQVRLHSNSFNMDTFLKNVVLIKSKQLGAVVSTDLGVILGFLTFPALLSQNSLQL